MTEQKPTAEALKAAHEMWQKWKDMPHAAIACHGDAKDWWIHQVAALITAKDAEIERLNTLVEQVQANRNHFCNYMNLIAKEFGTNKDSSAPEAVLRWVKEAREQNQQQRALLVEACRLIQMLSESSAYSGNLRSTFLSTPSVVELLKEGK